MTETSERTVRVAFCGCGRIAWAHAKELQRIPGVELCAFWNRTESRAQDMADKLGGYCAPDFQRIADDPGIDAVYVNTMHNDRLRIVGPMAEAGKAIFSEKPLAHNAETLRELHALLQKRDVLFWSGNKMRFNTLMEKARALVPAPEILSAHVLDEIWPEGGLNDPDVGGGNVMSQGVYATECIRLLEYERETWVMVMRKAQSDKDSEARDTPAPPPNPLATIRPGDAPAAKPHHADHPSLSIQG